MENYPSFIVMLFTLFQFCIGRHQLQRETYDSEAAKFSTMFTS